MSHEGSRRSSVSEISFSNSEKAKRYNDLEMDLEDEKDKVAKYKKENENPWL
jgi:hypothetical protein